MNKQSLLALAQCLLATSVLAHPPVLSVPASERVIGGTAAPPDSFPSAVSLEVLTPDGVGLCGGVLVNNHTVVTAAHCVYNFDTNTDIPAANMHVGYGSNSKKNQTFVPVHTVHVHYRFDAEQMTNDLAILTIDPVAYSASVRPATIYSGLLENGTKLTAVGWGLTIPGGNWASLPDKLQETEIVIGTPEECRKLVPTYETSNGPQVCTQNSLRPGSDTCQGDSGTGVYINVGGENYVVGVTSFGAAPNGDPTCALNDGLAIYTHLYYYLPYINEYAGTTVTGPAHRTHANRRHRHNGPGRRRPRNRHPSAE
ncbi:hypothetical protein IWQ56_000224 [Coemansia nantahalensis]|nr:hypothetical protein IWQ56_000224 [Coemansia nantahalensis]